MCRTAARPSQKDCIDYLSVALTTRGIFWFLLAGSKRGKAGQTVWKTND